MEYTFADRLEGITGSAIRELFKLTAQPDIISFAGGNPAPESFPTQEVDELLHRLMASQGAAVLQYGETEGWRPLRQSVADMVKTRGVAASMENVLTLTGSSQGIDLLARVLLNPGDVILAEAPTFLGALQTFKTYQANIVSLETDDEGVIPEDLEEKIKRHNPKALYIIPTFQNPSGKTLGLERRKRIAEITAKAGVIVMEDDPYRDVRFEGDPLPAIKSFDAAGNVVLLISFSKVISPGIRVGAAIGEPDILRKMVICKQGADTHTSNLTQALTDLFLRSDGFWPHVDRICGMYKQRRDAMAAMMPQLGIRFTMPYGGLFLWGELPRGMDALELLKEAVKHKVAFIPGTHFFADGGHQSAIRFNFSNANEEKIRRGMEILGEVIRGFEG